MALSFVGTSNTLSTSGGSWVGIPTHQANDFFLCVIETANDAAYTVGGDYTLIDAIGTGTPGGTDATQLALYWKKAEGAAEAGPSITWSTGDHVIADLFVFRGQWTGGTPIDQVSSSVASVAAANVEFSGITTTTSNVWVMHVVSIPLDSASLAFDVLNDGFWANATIASLATKAVWRGTAATVGNGGQFTIGWGALASPGASGTTTSDAFLDAQSYVQAKIVFGLATEEVVSGYRTILAHRRENTLLRM